MWRYRQYVRLYRSIISISLLLQGLLQKTVLFCFRAFLVPSEIASRSFLWKITWPSLRQTLRDAAPNIRTALATLETPRNRNISWFHWSYYNNPLPIPTVNTLNTPIPMWYNYLMRALKEYIPPLPQTEHNKNTMPINFISDSSLFKCNTYRLSAEDLNDDFLVNTIGLQSILASFH